MCDDRIRREIIFTWYHGHCHTGSSLSGLNKAQSDYALKIFADMKKELDRLESVR